MKKSKQNESSNPLLTIIDVGARGGFHLFKNRWPDIRLFAFEPEPSSFLTLKNGYTPHPFQSIHLEQLALADYEGISDFFVTAHKDMCSLLAPDKATFQEEYQGEKAAPAWFDSLDLVETSQVAVTTLDRYCSTHQITTVDFLKIDTQGTELLVLKGASQLLDDKKIGLIKVEAQFATMYRNQSGFEAIDLFLTQKGYTLLSLDLPRQSWFSRLFRRNHIRWPSGDAYYLPAKAAIPPDKYLCWSQLYRQTR